MRRTTILIAFLLAALAGACTRKPAPVTAEINVPPPAEERLAIDIKYVGAPKMSVFAQPRADSALITQYGIGETVSILARQGDWCEVRTLDGSGWVRAADLITADEVKAVIGNTTPRFLTPPAPVNERARGEIVLAAKVNTEGEVFEVKTIKNTTRVPSLADANADALRKARFYPMLGDKGQRMTFTYEYKVYY